MNFVSRKAEESATNRDLSIQFRIPEQRIAYRPWLGFVGHPAKRRKDIGSLHDRWNMERTRKAEDGSEASSMLSGPMERCFTCHSITNIMSLQSRCERGTVFLPSMNTPSGRALASK